MPGASTPASAAGWRVVLVQADAETVAHLRAELADEIELVPVSAGRVLDLMRDDGPVGRRRPTLVVLGADLPAPVGLVHALRPDPRDLAAIVLTTPRNEDRTATLPLLFSAEAVRRLPRERLADLGKLAGALMEQIGHARRHAAVQAAAQQTLVAGGPARRQPGQHLLGALLNQVLTGALLLDAGRRLVAWNRKAAELLALSEPQAIGRPVTAWFPAEVRARLRAYLSGPPDPTDESAPIFTRATDDGVEQVLRLSPQPVTAPDGAEQILVLAEDVTEAVQARRALAERTSQALLSGKVAAAITADEPLARRLERCANALVEHLDAVVVGIWILTPSTDALVLQAGAPDTAALDDRYSRVPVGESVIGRIAAERRPYTSGDAGAEDREWARRAGATAFTGHPLVTGGQVMGVLAVWTRHDLRPTGARVVSGIADQIAVAVHRDRLLQRLRTTTDALQRPLLPPRLPKLPGFELAARYQPYGDGLHIGGDFYDAFPAPGGRWALVLGDVCGKGPAAAAVTGLVRHTLWAAAQQDPRPGHVLPLVDRALQRENSPFCTLVYALVEPGQEGALVRLACAGHPTPLLRRADGGTAPVVDPSHGSGPVLGVFDEVRYPVHSLRLNPGDSLVLYTDGFTEGAASYLKRDPVDLATVLAACELPSTRPAEHLVEAVMADAHTRWGARLRDDLAVLALTAVAPAESAIG